jgi:hypothetical protein
MGLNGKRGAARKQRSRQPQSGRGSEGVKPFGRSSTPAILYRDLDGGSGPATAEPEEDSYEESAEAEEIQIRWIEQNKIKKERR